MLKVPQLLGIPTLSCLVLATSGVMHIVLAARVYCLRRVRCSIGSCTRSAVDFRLHVQEL